MPYTIFNQLNRRCLVHPKVGLWFTNSKDDADKMLKDCHDYLDVAGLGNLKDNFIVVDFSFKV